MHEPLLARAALPAQVKVCGIPLRPYSLGHELLLIHENSPFLTGGGVFPGDLLTAIWICASTFEGAKNSQSSLWYLPRLLAAKRMVRKACERNIDREAVAFEDYRNEGWLFNQHGLGGKPSCGFPLSDVICPGGSGPVSKARTPGCPWLLRLHDFVCVRYQLSIADAWDFPVGEAVLRWEMHWEQEGGLQVYNEDNAFMDAAIEEEEAKEATK